MRDVLSHYLSILTVTHRYAPRCGTDELLLAWERAMEGEDPDRISRAFQRWITTQNVFPSPADILRVAGHSDWQPEKDQFWWCPFSYEFGGDPTSIPDSRRKAIAARLLKMGPPSGYNLFDVHADNYHRLVETLLTSKWSNV